MRPVDLMRRTAVRLAIGVTLIALSALFLAGVIGYSLLRSQLEARQNARITEIFMALQETTVSGDLGDLVEAVTTRIKASPDFATVYLLRGAKDEVLAGSLPDIWYQPGWSTVDAATLNIPTHYPYRIFASKVDGYTIVVGLTDADLDDLAAISRSAFAWSALGVLLAVIAVGAMIASRIQARIDEVEAVLQRVARGDLTARLSVSRAGSDLDQLSVSINNALGRLGNLVEAMRQVSADIAHDLRTPLNRLRIRIEAASEAAANGLPVGADLTAALAESDAISQTFSALLRIAQIEAGTSRKRFTQLDLCAVMGAVAEVYTDVAEDANMTLTCQTSGPLMIEGDKDLLTQAFANLIENALRHCPPGTTITCAVVQDGAQVAAIIRDTGPGIPVAERENVLRRHYRLEKSRTTEGFGLGLALVKAVADLHHAALTLADGDPGLCVRLLFRQAKAQA